MSYFMPSPRVILFITTVYGSVMDHWSRMFGIINLVGASRQLITTRNHFPNRNYCVVPPRESVDNDEGHVEEQPPKAEKLVRLEIASLEQVTTGSK